MASVALVRGELTSLGPKDILISPQLGNYSSYDFADELKIVSAGESAVRAAQAQLQALSLPPAQYAQYLAARAAKRSPLPPVEFVRVDPDSAVSGQGLGLFIARSLVESHGGKLTARSTPLRGSTFTVELPRRTELPAGTKHH